MKRLLLPLLAALALPTIAGDFGPADLLQEQISKAFPKVGTKWDGFCGTFEKGQDCTIELGENQLIINDEYRVNYEQIKNSEKHNTFVSITRLSQLDPLFGGWERYRKVGNVKFFNNTVLVEYINKNGKDGLALFSFRENQISQWYGFANAMRMISKGARPELPKTNLD